MNEAIKAWIDAEREVSLAIARASALADEAELAPLPTNLRPANAADIREGEILWYPEWDERKWCRVDQVLRPDDEWKAYCGHDGCRYGLDGAHVEA